MVYLLASLLCCKRAETRDVESHKATASSIPIGTREDRRRFDLLHVDFILIAHPSDDSFGEASIRRLYSPTDVIFATRH